jgi:transposase-like protein
MASGSTTSRTYSAATKRKAVHALLNRGDTPVQAIADKFGVYSAQLYQWRDAIATKDAAAALQTAPAVTPTNGKSNGHSHAPLAEVPPPVPVASNDDDELARLRTENAELRAWVKKLL